MSNFKAEASDFDKAATPKLPARAFGTVWHTGWDIPSYWAVDADDVPYADYTAHGCNMVQTTFDELIRHVEEAGESCSTDVNYIRQLAGRPKALPNWAKTALAQGWTPPATFKREDYE